MQRPHVAARARVGGRRAVPLVDSATWDGSAVATRQVEKEVDGRRTFKAAPAALVGALKESPSSLTPRFGSGLERKPHFIAIRQDEEIIRIGLDFREDVSIHLVPFRRGKTTRPLNQHNLSNEVQVEPLSRRVPVKKPMKPTIRRHRNENRLHARAPHC